MRKSSAGLTLIELIVVILILFALTGILVPVFSKAREDGRKAACLSNERHLGIAILSYSQDYDVYPSVNDWTQRRIPTGGVVFNCPSLSATEGGFDTGLGHLGYAYTMAPLGYCAEMNQKERAARKGGQGGVVTDPSDYRLPVPLVTHPANTIVVGETIFGINMMGSVPVIASHIDRSKIDKECKGGAGCDDKIKSDGLIDTRYGSIRHNGGVNYLFFDGHAKWLTPSPWMAAGGPNDGTKPTLSL